MQSQFKANITDECYDKNLFVQNLARDKVLSGSQPALIFTFFDLNNPLDMLAKQSNTFFATKKAPKLSQRLFLVFIFSLDSFTRRSFDMVLGPRVPSPDLI